MKFAFILRYFAICCCYYHGVQMYERKTQSALFVCILKVTFVVCLYMHHLKLE